MFQTTSVCTSEKWGADEMKSSLDHLSKIIYMTDSFQSLSIQPIVWFTRASVKRLLSFENLIGTCLDMIYWNNVLTCISLVGLFKSNFRFFYSLSLVAYLWIRINEGMEFHNIYLSLVKIFYEIPSCI